MIQLERTECGSYCTPDERFWVQRYFGDDGRPRRGWVITDTAGQFTFPRSVPSLNEAEDAIDEALTD